MAMTDRNNPKRAKSSDSAYSLMEFVKDFPDDAACLEWLWAVRYATEDPDFGHCPKCEQVRRFARYETKQQRQSWTCTACGLHVHPTAGTIFHKSSTSLHLWFYAMYLMTSTRCGISAKQLERELGVTYKTAWRMFHLIRNELMTQDDEPLTGAVEMDEMYVGGKLRQSDRAKFSSKQFTTARRTEARNAANAKKTPVFGAVERGGRVTAHVVPSTQLDTIMAHVTKRVEATSMIYTDDANLYTGLPKAGYPNHDVVKHMYNVYVSGDVHTQTIDGFWSLVKRGLSGTHHSVSAKHLQGYLNEYAWRYNNRDAKGPAMFLLLALRAANPVASV